MEADAEKVKNIRSVLGDETLDSDILRALSIAGSNENAAINIILDTPGFLSQSVTVKRSSAGSGARISSEIKKEVPDEDDFGDAKPKIRAKEAESDLGFVKRAKPERKDADFMDLTETQFLPYLNPRPISCVKPGKNMDRRIQVSSGLDQVENGEFPEEAEWFLVGRATVKGLSTCRGRKLEFDEIVDFSFPSSNGKKVYNRQWGSSKGAVAFSEIVRFSTKRSGEVLFSSLMYFCSY